MVNHEYLMQVIREHFEPIRQWIDDKAVTEIMINPGGKVFIESSGEIIQLDMNFPENTIEMCIKTIAKLVGKDAKSSDASAIVNAAVDDMRVAGGLYPVCPEGSFLTLRKHMSAQERPTLDDLVEKKKALTRQQADLLTELVICQRKNCIFAGGTGSGKTTLINAILSLIPHYERVISVEDARELNIPLPDAFTLITNPQAGLTARLAIQTLLRHRPDRIIVGETRGDETYDLIRALNSGHPGSMSSVHSNSALDALDTLQMLYQQSLPPNASLPAEEVKKFIARVVNVVVYVHRAVQIIDGRPTVMRGVKEICLVKGVENGNFVLENITDHSIPSKNPEMV